MADKPIAGEDPRTAAELTGAEELLLQLLTSNYRLALSELKTWIVAAITDSAPGTLDTLNELAAALGDDPNFAATMTTALAGKQPLDSDLTAIAAITTASFGRDLLALASAPALCNALGRKIPTGRAMVPEGNLVRAAGSAFGSATMRGFLGYIRSNVTLEALAGVLTTTAASGNCQFAVYAASSTAMAPTGAPVYSSGNISTAASPASITGLSVALTAGYYWFFTNCDANAATAVFPSFSSTAMGFGQMMGAATLGNAVGATGGRTGVALAQTFGTWPTLTGSLSGDGFSETSGVAVPMLEYRVS